MSKKRVQIKPCFRRHKINGHPCYIYDEFNNEYKYIGITHSPITQGLKNKKLKFNPDINDSRNSYLRPFSTHDDKKNFKVKKLKGFRIHKADKKLGSKIKKNYRT